MGSQAGAEPVDQCGEGVDRQARLVQARRRGPEPSGPGPV